MRRSDSRATTPRLHARTRSTRFWFSRTRLRLRCRTLSLHHRERTQRARARFALRWHARLSPHRAAPLTSSTLPGGTDVYAARLMDHSARGVVSSCLPVRWFVVIAGLVDSHCTAAVVVVIRYFVPHAGASLTSTLFAAYTHSSTRSRPLFFSYRIHNILAIPRNAHALDHKRAPRAPIMLYTPHSQRRACDVDRPSISTSPRHITAPAVAHHWFAGRLRTVPRHVS